MKTQISRDTFDTEQRYSGVYLQQGRMILDADWNELTDIEKRRLTDALKDAISGTNKTGGAIAGGAPRVGGLKLIADPADASGKTILIDPGTLYVDGIPARMPNGDPVAANAQPDYPYAVGYTGLSQRLYADVWERTVTALNDTAPLSEGGELRASPLMDAGLHGADTATRTQILLQVKWCSNGVDPLDKNVNPRRGNAKLQLKLRAITSSGDTCDPCASQVEVDERIGNYLFRVEVHDYVGTVLTLKWSRDNAAEACATAAMPSGFDKGDWVWEFFDDDSEKLLGKHFNQSKDWLGEYFAGSTANQDAGTYSASPTKVRGVILETCTTPEASNVPQDYARQWDGYIRIDLADPTNKNKLSGRDRGVDLALDKATQDQGQVVVSGGILKINLELMELAIEVAGTAFVPGDFWQAAVRESEQESGDIVLDQETPVGILHHYLYLGELKSDQTLKAENNAFARRMAFPPLSDLTAPDVGYVLPGCSGNTIRQQLNSILSAFPGATVADILNTLLCNLTALSLPYNVSCPSDALVTNVGIVPTDDTVGEVLNKLLCNLDATTLPYAVTCLSGALPVKLGVISTDDTVAEVLTKLLCNLDSLTLPHTVTCLSGALAIKLGLISTDDTVGEVLHKLVCNLNSLTLPHTVTCPGGALVTKLGIVTADDTVGEVLNKLLCSLDAATLPYTVSCPSDALVTKLGIVAGDDTVAEVLNKLLCNLDAATLPYTVPCPSASLVTSMGITSGDDTVTKVLDKVLCNLDAASLPLDKGATLCNDLQAEGVNSVQDALNILCGKSGSGCAVVATSAGHLQTLLEEFATTSATDLWVCLKAGTYPLDASPDGKPILSLTGKNSLRITGQGKEAVIITLSGGSLAAAADEVILENLSITFAADSQLALTCKRAEAHGCYFKRVATAQGTPAMLSITPTSGYFCHLDWRGNSHYAVASVVSSEYTYRWAEQDIVGDKTLSTYLNRMDNALVAGDLVTYDKYLAAAASTVSRMTLEARSTWSNRIYDLNYPATLDINTRLGVQAGIYPLRSALSATKITVTAASNALKAASSLRTRVYEDNALHLVNDDIGGNMDGNELDGWLLFGSTATGYATPSGLDSVSTALTSSLVIASGSELRLAGNHITAIKTSLPTSAFSGTQLIARVAGLTRLSLVDNVIEDDANTLVASTFLANGNSWRGYDSNLGGVITDRAVLTGNLVNDDQDYSRLNVTIQASREPPQLNTAGNLLFEVLGVR